MQALAVRAEEVDRPKWRSRIVPVMAAVILTAILALVYYVSTHQPSRRATNVPIPPPAEAPVDNAVAGAPASTEHDTETTAAAKSKERPSVSNDPSDRQPVDAPTHDTKISEKPDAKTSDRNKPQVKNSERGTAADKPSDKDESKVRSMINKTKRFIKKNLPL